MVRKSPRENAPLKLVAPKAPAFSTKKTEMEDEDNISVNLSEHETPVKTKRVGGQTIAGLGQRSQLSMKSSAMKMQQTVVPKLNVAGISNSNSK